MLDTVHPVETPEGVRLVLRAAGPVPRALAFLTDALVRTAGYLAALIVLAFTVGELTVPLLMLIFFLGEWFYPVFFEVGWRGQTLGKRAVGIRVVMQDGTRIGWSASILRNLLLAADWIPGTYAAGLVSCLVSGNFRRLGDLAAGTLVVHVDQPPGPPPLQSVVPLPSPVPLSLEEQRAVIAFAQRAPLLSEERANELASLPTPLLAPGEAPAPRLVRIGAWLLGRGTRTAP